MPAPGIKFKKSPMPFVQMENISHFLRACQAPPLNLHQHDTFLTVDLYEQKDPAQVLQCLGAFSRAANAASPRNFPTTIGVKSRAGAVSPQRTGPRTPTGARDRGISVTSNASSTYGGPKPPLPHRREESGSGRVSPTKSPQGSGSPGTMSSWSKREQEGVTAPAWNISQYGYMGGASQGNLGITFGGRRQIIGSGPDVPSLADKERIRKEKQAEEDRMRQEEEERRRAQLEAEEERARQEEERRWEDETQRQRSEEKRKAEEEQRRWEDEERQWKLTEEKRRQEEAEAEARLAQERQRTRSRSDVRLQGQFLSQYQAEQQGPAGGQDEEGGYSSRVKELEKELEQARQRESEYERERQQRSRGGRGDGDAKARSRSRSRQESWSQDEREILRTEWAQQQEERQAPKPSPLSVAAVASPPTKSSRPLPDPTATPPLKTQPVKTHNTGGRPLPDPAKYASPPQQQQQQQPAGQSRTDRFLSSNPAPAAAATQQTYSRELGATAERDAEDRRRAQSQGQTKAGGWASKSLLEREMEMERQRQREWEEAQKETAAAARSGDGVDGIGGGVGGRWDVGQWSGFTGGDNQNKGGQGIGSGRRQIVGPRPLPGSNR